MTATVHLSKCSSYERKAVAAAVCAAIEAVIPADLVRPGTRVLLKPNVINDMPPERAVCTHPEVVRAVAEWVLGQGAKVIIADQPGYALTEEAAGAFQNTGMLQACADLDVEFKLLARGGYDQVTPLRTYRLKQIQFAREVLQADVVINLPKAKTHSQTLYTGAIKNLFGAIAPRQRIDVHLVGKYWALSEAIVDCYAACPPHLHLMDAIVIMEGMGPTQGKPRELGAIVASTDGVALDAVTGALLGFEAGEVATTVAAGNLKLGEANLDHITVTGSTVAELTQVVERSPAVRAEMLGPFLPILRWLVTARPHVQRQSCQACGACAGICPAGAVTIEDYALIDCKTCVECFCCQEACPFDAIQVKRPWVYNGVWRLKRAFDRMIGRRVEKRGRRTV